MSFDVSWEIVYEIPKITDLDDVDSQVEITALPPSDGGDTDSESEAGDTSKEMEEFPETPYVFAPEPEFGGVSTRFPFV